jgi:hypothetical protein
MWILKQLMGGIAIATLAACGIAVTTTADPTVSFANLQTYAWDDKASPLTATMGMDAAARTEIDELIRNIVNEGLDGKGYRETTGSPDFIVSYRVLFESPGYPYGTLVLDIIDPVSGRIGWTGSAENVIDPSDVKALEANTRAGVAKMLRRFPPER